MLFDNTVEYIIYDMMFIPILLLLALSLFINILSKCKKKKKMPPGPWRLPILGNLHLLNPNKPQQSLLNLSKKHGPLMLLQLGSIPTLIVSSRDVAKEIFTNHDLTFSGRPLLTASKKLFKNNPSITFSPHGGRWRQGRKIFMLQLLSPHRVRAFKAVRGEEIEKLVANIKDVFVVANLSELIRSFTNNIVCRVTLGDEFGDGRISGDVGARLHELLLETQSLLGSFLVADFFPRMEWVDGLRGFHGRLEKKFEEMDTFFDRVIQEYLKNGEEGEESDNVINDSGGDEEKDLVCILLRLHKMAVHGGFLSSIDQVKSILWEALIAGTDTSLATIIWTMTELIRNPRILYKLQEELKQATNEDICKLIQESDLEKLPYLKQVIKESMRLKPPVPLLVPRETIQPCRVQGYEVPAKTRVIINAMAISTDSNVWEKPLEFWPERFEGNDITFMGQDYEFLPFGSGRRKCPGISFAMVIVELALANLLHCFDWSLPDGMKAEDISMEEAIGITVHKKVALCLVAKPKW